MMRREASVWRFGPFEVDSMRPEVRSPGSRIKLQDLPHRLLVYLLDRPGLLVAREELREHLWPEDHFIDFEHGLNTASKKLRSALSDSAIDPRYIARLACEDWGLCRTVELNIAKLITTLDELDVDRELVLSRIAEFRAAIDNGPKPLRWRLRAQVGDRLQWYELPEETRSPYQSE